MRGNCLLFFIFDYHCDLTPVPRFRHLLAVAHYASWALLIVPVYAVHAVVVPLVSAATGVPAYSGNPFLVNHMFAYFVLGCMMVGNVFFLAAALNTARTLVIIKVCDIGLPCVLGGRGWSALSLRARARACVCVCVCILSQTESEVFSPC